MLVNVLALSFRLSQADWILKFSRAGSALSSKRHGLLQFDRAN